jgi:putative SOS response-associated peptidase YedK
MCTRFIYKHQESVFQNVFGIRPQLPYPLQKQFNIAPTDGVVAVAKTWNHPMPMRWGLIPHWWNKPLSELPATFIARAETVAERTMYKAAFKYRRCLIPANGYFLWTGERNERRPYVVYSSTQPLWAFAGIWDHFQSPDGSQIETAAIITVPSSPELRNFDNRMPLILRRNQFDSWLHTSYDKLKDLNPILKNTDSVSVRLKPTDPRFGNPRFECPTILEQIQPVR